MCVIIALASSSGNACCFCTVPSLTVLPHSCKQDKITDAAFQCFCDIEVSIRRFLNVNNTIDMNESFCTKVTSAILPDDYLLFNWTFASKFIVDQDISDSVSNHLSHRICANKHSALTQGKMVCYF